MDVSSSAMELCVDLISGAFQRCRASQDICRLSVILRSSPSSDPSVVRVSISDTGIGSSLEEFNNLKCVHDAQSWDGMLSVTTTGISEHEVHYYVLNLRESIGSRRRLTRLPSNTKNGSIFSGTEVRLWISESMDALESTITHFLRKILILKVPNVALELLVECEDIPGSRREDVFLANESKSLPFSVSNIERFKSGLKDYVLKHGHGLNQNCNSCFPNPENLKFGTGMSCSLENQRSPGLIMEVVIIISESAPSCPCFSLYISKTEVLHFEDFRPRSVSNQFLYALSTIDWKSYGMAFRNVGDREGNLLVLENLPPNTHIAIALHCYHKEVLVPSAKRKTQIDRYLIKKAIKLALDDLKEKYAGILLSEHALKIRSYAPDLAKSIAGLILSSNDSSFQEECLSLLGLQTREIGEEIVKDCIKEKIISIVDTNDRKSQKSKQMATTPFLFEDNCCWNPNFQESDYEGQEDKSELAFNYSE